MRCCPGPFVVFVRTLQGRTGIRIGRWRRCKFVKVHCNANNKDPWILFLEIETLEYPFGFQRRDPGKVGLIPKAEFFGQFRPFLGWLVGPGVGDRIQLPGSARTWPGIDFREFRYPTEFLRHPYLCRTV